MSDILANAIRGREQLYREALDRARERAEELGEEFSDQCPREAIELVGCLRRLVSQCTVTQIHQAFGAPGDFGYDSPIGDALSHTYRSAARPT